jgi:hypothetical protein
MDVFQKYQRFMAASFGRIDYPLGSRFNRRICSNSDEKSSLQRQRQDRGCVAGWAALHYQGRDQLDWPSAPGDEYRVLRKGTNEWTCLPGVPGYDHDEPGCFDPVFLQWIKDSLAGRDPRIDRIGIAYMYAGAWVPNKSGTKTDPNSDEFHVGPHIMIVSPHQYQDELRPLSHDGSNGMPYVAHLPHGTDLYLVLPFRQWDDK